MALSWSGRRQLMYYGVGLVLLVAFIYVVWASFFNTAPTCRDGQQDGTELGVDCGGSCALLCQDSARPPVALWARPFDAGANTYTVAAYVQNNNLGSGAKAVPYSFQLFDDNNSLVKEVDGSADLPPVAVVPIIVPNINVGNRVVTHVQFAFAAPPVWYKVPANSLPALLISQQNHNSDYSQVSATIRNQAQVDAKNITVAVVLFDSQGVARAASKSYVASVPARSQQEVVFTWPTGTPDIVRAEVTVLPSF
jgi:hypothetical protein